MSKVILHTKTAILRGMQALCAALVIFSATDAGAQGLMNSPAGGLLPTGISLSGGIVVDLIGLNGTRVVAELPNISLLSSDGFISANVTTIGTQSGYTSTVLGALGNGISKAAFRITLWDGDSAPGEFDYGQNELSVNGIMVENFSAVPTTQIMGTTNVSTNPAGGFRAGIYDTGFLSS